ncbi:hypothetical protein BZA05DRAFT_19138 [Tricharina praecox]|uniref:uncharacterized protein n=1 Tax=Tricharina praecox TaxID=43433 RepID=UPI00221EFEF6|nr:uncharacterized protein BZA05DRAFT_19138 [Tricharina praecox]KAI5858987.1 hypothetical protein BZA05DRAFT_19138 [Tricharina praecox]
MCGPHWKTCRYWICAISASVGAHLLGWSWSGPLGGDSPLGFGADVGSAIGVGGCFLLVLLVLLLPLLLLAGTGPS